MAEAPVVDDSIGAEGVDKRAEPRHRVFLGGKVVFDNTACSQNCTITDLSEHGARIRPESPDLMPSRFFLIDVKQGIAFDAQVVRSTYPELGLHFLAKHNLLLSSSPEFRALRKLWLDIAPR